MYVHNPDRCCHDRKIVPLRRAVAGYDAWISSIRADQSAHRARANVVGWDAKFGLVKINPNDSAATVSFATLVPNAPPGNSSSCEGTFFAAYGVSTLPWPPR